MTKIEEHWKDTPSSEKEISDSEIKTDEVEEEHWNDEPLDKHDSETIKQIEKIEEIIKLERKRRRHVPPFNIIGKLPNIIGLGITFLIGRLVLTQVLNTLKETENYSYLDNATSVVGTFVSSSSMVSMFFIIFVPIMLIAYIFHKMIKVFR